MRARVRTSPAPRTCAPFTPSMVRLFASVYRNSARSDPPMSGWSAFRHVTAPASRLQAWGGDRIEGERAVKPLLAPLTASLGAIATGASILALAAGADTLSYRSLTAIARGLSRALIQTWIRSDVLASEARVSATAS